jgi:NTE family protein
VLPAFKLGADVVIAVDIAAGLDDARYDRGVDIMERANAIKDSALVSHLKRLADVVIAPEIKDVHWADFGAYERCIEAGAKAAEQELPRIRQLLRHEKFLSVLRPGPGRRLAEMYMETGEPELRIE